ncbi:MAG: DUF3857 and transglutaminase domain-containing protein [FCB group bacterium]|nr:DUF3857 and transglutaminase domain-containing protein [FCB group bacterium]
MISYTRTVRYFLFFCFLGAAVTAQKFGEISAEEWAVVPPVDYPEAKAVVIFDHGEMEVTVYPLRVKLVRHVRIKVFNKAGAEEYLTVDLPYAKGDKIKSVKAHTINPDGEICKIKKLYNKSAGGYKTKSFSFPSVEDGAIVEYQYTQTHQRLALLDPWYFQNPLYTMESRFSVTPAPGLSYSAGAHSVPDECRDPKAEDVVVKGLAAQKFTWTLHDILPAEDEPLIGAELDYKSSLYLQLTEYRDSRQHIPFIKNWASIGAMVKERKEELLNKCNDLVQELSDSLCAGCEDNEEKKKACYFYVRDNIETRDDAENNSYKNLLKNKTADATDKNILFSVLLQKQGLNANPMMIGTRDQHARLRYDAIQMDMINYVIGSVFEDDEYFGYDTNDKNSVYPYLPTRALVENGLIVDEDTCRFRSLKHYQRKSGLDASSFLAFHEDGSATCTTTVWIRGYNMNQYLEYVEDSVDSKFWMEKLFGDVDFDYEVKDISIVRELEQDRIKCKLVMQFPSFCENINDNYLFSPFSLSLFKNPFTSSRRVFPVDFRFPFKNRVRHQILLPEGMLVHEVPDDIDHKSRGLKYTRACMAQGNLINIKEELDITNSIFHPSDYGMLKGVFDAIITFNEDQILFTASPVAGDE